MRKTYSIEKKSEIVNQYLCGQSITNLFKLTGIARSTIYKWIAEYANNLKRNNPINMSDYIKLQKHCNKLENTIKILKSADCTVNATLHERYEVIKDLSDAFSITTLCSAMNVAKGSYYNHILRNKNENSLVNKRKSELKVIIEEIYNETNQVYGAGKITAILNDRGHHVSYATVSSIMHENNWFSIRNCAKTLYVQAQKRKENIVNQQFNPSKPNEVWVSDVTYFKFNKKTYYICIVMDLFARKIISCRVSMKNSTQLTKSTFKAAYESRAIKSGLIFHTDQGSNYISKTFMKYLNSLNVTQSFSKKGTPYDNSVCESFFSNLKREELYRKLYRSENDFKSSLTKYIAFYNTKRPHSTLNYRTPVKAEDDFIGTHAENIKD